MFYTQAQTESLAVHQFAHLRAQQQGHVLTLTLDRPEKKNALNATLTNELAFALAYAHFRTDVWVVVLAANGDVFCAGADLRAWAGETQTSDSTVPPPAEPVRLGDAFAGLEKPCVARLHAPVYAGGLLLVGGCTHVMAADTVTFSLPEVKRGIFPFQVMASLLPLMPARALLDWCIRARTLSATEAQALGLVTDVLPAHALDRAVAALVDDILQYSPTAIQLGLRAYWAVQQLAPDRQHAYLYQLLQQALQTDDAVEGLAAFAQKRPPAWTGS